MDQGTSAGSQVCPNCGETNDAGAARCAACGVNLAARRGAPFSAAPQAGFVADDDDDLPRSRRTSGPRCPNCGAHMERGAVEISPKMLDVIFSSLSAHSLWFHPVEGKRREVLKAGQKRRALLCSICGGFWMR